MLHHIPSVELQDAALTEIARVLSTGSLLVGCDGLDASATLRLGARPPIDATTVT